MQRIAWERREGQASLIGLMVTMAVIMLVVYFVWLKPKPGEQTEPRFEGEAQTTLGAALQKGQSAQCIEYLRQLRMAVQMEQTTMGQNPAQLSASWGVTLKCPVSGQLYRYDPASGRVWCTTPGHERY